MNTDIWICFAFDCIVVFVLLYSIIQVILCKFVSYGTFLFYFAIRSSILVYTILFYSKRDMSDSNLIHVYIKKRRIHISLFAVVIYSCVPVQIVSAKWGRWQLAFDLLKCMASQTELPNARTFNAAIAACATASEWQHALFLHKDQGWNFGNECPTRWWFQIFFIFTPIWGRFPFWLIFFKWVETTN